MKNFIFVIGLILIGSFLFGCQQKAKEEALTQEVIIDQGGTAMMTETQTEAPTPQTPENLTMPVPEEMPISTPAAFEKPSDEQIQQALKNAGLYDGAIDGVVGPKTKKAIEDFQAQNGLVVDGKVGPKTWQKLQTYLNQEPASSSTISD